MVLASVALCASWPHSTSPSLPPSRSTGAQLLKWPREQLDQWGAWFLFGLFGAILVWVRPLLRCHRTKAGTCRIARECCIVHSAGACAAVQLSCRRTSSVQPPCTAPAPQEEVWDLPHTAYLSGWLLVLITAGAVVCSLFFERRMWCRYLCPIGGMNGGWHTCSRILVRIRRQEHPVGKLFCPYLPCVSAGMFAKLSMTELRARQGVCSSEERRPPMLLVPACCA